VDASRLKGMSVVSVSEATRLGVVRDVVMDRDPMRAAGFDVRFDGTDFVIPFAEVRSLGTDALTVDSSGATQMRSAGDEFGKLPRLTDMLKLKIVDDAGTLLGTLATVELDPATGLVVRLVAHQGGMLGMGGKDLSINVAAVRTVGTDIITVTHAPSEG
jgi:sporulation protein YlmC with PRC-barrel domain